MLSAEELRRRKKEGHRWHRLSRGALGGGAPGASGGLSRTGSNHHSPVPGAGQPVKTSPRAELALAKKASKKEGDNGRAS